MLTGLSENGLIFCLLSEMAWEKLMAAISNTVMNVIRIIITIK